VNFFRKLDHILYRVIQPVVVVVGLGVSLMIVVGIVSRTLFGSPVFGLEELMLLAIMWFYMLGAVLASRESSHLSADFVHVMTSNKAIHRAAFIVSTVISIIASLAFCYWAADFLAFGISRGQSTPVFRIPFWVSQLSLFVAAILLTAYLVRDLIVELRGGGHGSGDPIAEVA
jgi:TRAP-type transport system small permease protein